MKSLSKSKLVKVRRKMERFISDQKDTHQRLLSITPSHRYATFEFYLEYFKNNFEVTNLNNKVQELMFVMSELILPENDLPSKDLKNVIDFCTFVLKNSKDENVFEKITDCARKMTFGTKSEDETIKNSISSFIKMIYFNPASINHVW